MGDIFDRHSIGTRVSKPLGSRSNGLCPCRYFEERDFSSGFEDESFRRYMKNRGFLYNFVSSCIDYLCSD